LLWVVRCLLLACLNSEAATKIVGEASKAMVCGGVAISASELAFLADDFGSLASGCGVIEVGCVHRGGSFTR
jgi:hypothetical protein